MAITNLLNAIQDLRQALDQWSVTASGLVIIALIAACLFVWSFRKVALWFFQISQLRLEIAELKSEVLKLQQLGAVQPAHSIELESNSKSDENLIISEAPSQDGKRIRFQFDH